MADEFVQVVKFKVDDKEIVAAIDRIRKAFGEGAGAKGPADALDKNLKKASKSASDTAKQAQNIARATKEATRETNRLTSAFDRMKGAVTGLVAAYAGFKGISAIVGFGKGSIDAFTMQRRAELQLDTVLKNRGVGFASGYIKNAASEIQKRTTIGDESMIAGAAELATYVRDPRQLKRMMALLADYSMGMTGGAELSPEALTNLATGLGKAFDGSYEAMRKKGFDTSELEMITDALKLQEDLAKGNIKRDKNTDELKLSSDQKELLQWLKANKGRNLEDLKISALERAMADWKGLADEFANTDEGKIQQLKNTIGDMREEIGAELLPVVGELAGSMKANLPALKELFGGLRDVLLSMMNAVKGHVNEIREFSNVMADSLKLFSKAPFEITAFLGAMKLFGPAMFAARTAALETTTAFDVMGKTMSGIAKGGLMALTIWAVGKIAEAARAGKEYLGEESKRMDREGHYADFNEAMRHVNSMTDFQKGLGLTGEQVAAARARMGSIPAGFNFGNVRDPSVGKLFAGLDSKQVEWMMYEYEKRGWRSKADAASALMHAVGASKGSTPENEVNDINKMLNDSMAKLTKNSPTINDIKVYNDIHADSDMTAKIIKEQLRVFATSQLNFTSRTAAAKVLAL
jgi:hypothetical protein